MGNQIAVSSQVRTPKTKKWANVKDIKIANSFILRWWSLNQLTNHKTIH